ncbi:MAG: hypothetical protein HY928_13685 [Elusimicrobia bacterium]|nr:hypothetical protein [Elusimicrobiota bacterium]
MRAPRAALASTILVLISALAFAADRYFLVSKSARGNTYIDTTTAVLYEPRTPYDPVFALSLGRELDCWLRSESAEAYELVHMLISMDEEVGLFSKQLEFRVYRTSGEQIDGKVFNEPKWKLIIREDAERTALSALEWAEKNLKAKPAPSVK